MPASWVTRFHAPPQSRDGAFIVTRYADVLALQRHPDIGVWEPWLDINLLGRRAGRDYAGVTGVLQGILFNRNDAEHSSIRRMWRQALDSLASALEPATVAAVIDAKIREARAAGRIEAMELLCRAIPTAVMVGALGLAPSCVSAIRRSVASVFAVYQRGVSLRVLDAIDADARTAYDEIMCDLARARREPRMGLARLLPLVGADFDEHALADYVFFFALASVETLTGLFGSMTLLLLTHPDQWRKLVADPSLVAPCVEESIRFAAPVRRLTPRIARKAVTVAGVTIPAGAIIMLELEQAHHDPEAFVDPEKFDITRKGRPNMGFGLGAHACLGGSLARLEARIYLQALRDAGPIALLDAEPAWEDHVSFRRLERLELEFS
jgi:cytochrome P450